LPKNYLDYYSKKKILGTLEERRFGEAVGSVTAMRS
jgi:hypothetical protein